MLTLDQCIDLCGLDHDEVEAIARHASVPEIVAAQMACQMLKSREGKAQLDCILHERLAAAKDCATPCRDRACGGQSRGRKAKAAAIAASA